MLRNEGERLTRVLVCPPGDAYTGVEVPDEHGMLEPADEETVREQYRGLRTALASGGAEVVEVPELPGHPNSVFVRDTALVTPFGHLQLRMSLPSRAGEAIWMSETLSALGMPCTGEIEEPGTVEGGDVILAGEVAFVGSSARTNREGAEQVSRLLEDQGYEVRTAPVNYQYMHIGGMMSMIGPRTVLCASGLFPDDFFRGFTVVPLEHSRANSMNVICLSEEEAIVDASEAPRTAEALTERGIRVHALDLSEYGKGGGGPTCTILPLERVPTSPPARRTSSSSPSSMG
ncbi:MAG: arginine deiminase family protein [bacterium]